MHEIELNYLSNTVKVNGRVWRGLYIRKLSQLVNWHMAKRGQRIYFFVFCFISDSSNTILQQNDKRAGRVARGQSASP